MRDVLDRAGLGGLSPRALRAAVALGGIVVALGLWRFWPAAPAPEVAFDAPAALSEEASVSEEESQAPLPEVVVHVAGAVIRPDVYSLPPGSRVVDAIKAAGGGLGTAATGSLNLARIVCDGEQVYVPTVEEVAAGLVPDEAVLSGGGAGEGVGSGASANGVVNINRASAAELEELPGVGPATAQKIMDDREANGPYAKPEDLMRVPGIGSKKFEAMREFVTCG